MEVDPMVLYVVGALCLGFILVVNLYQVIMHLKNYTEPRYQRFILRIVFIVPVTGVMSFCVLVLPDESIWFDTVRQWYEAWVIYNFTCLLLAYVGGPGQVETKLDGKQINRSCLMCTCCFSPRWLVVNGRYIMWCKRMTLQFVYIITPLSIITVILFTKGLYNEGNWSPSSFYFWIQLAYNVSYSLALSALFFFYYGTHELLEPFKPMLKFVVIKGVVFLTFWQGVVCSSLYSFGVIATAEQAKILQDFLTLIEMVLAAAIMSYAFPWKEYMMLSGHRQGLQIETIRDAVSIHDVVSDTYHSFAPAYHDYVLYSDGNKTPISSAKKGRSKKKFRARTFLMMGQESTAQHAGQHMETGKEMEMRMWNGGQSPSDCGSHETEDLTRSSTTPIIQGSSRPPSECNMDIINEDPYDCEFGDVNRLDRGPAAEVKANNVDDDAEQAASSQQAVAGRKWVHIDLDTKK